MIPRLSHVLLILVAAGLFGAPALAGEDVELYDSDGNVLTPAQIDEVSIRNTCGDCHDVDESAKALHFNQGEEDPDPETSDCLSCHLGKTNPFNSDGQIRATSAQLTDDHCTSCHFDVADEMAEGAHANQDKKPGDHPTCISCHDAKAHSVAKLSGLDRRRKTELCSGCHRRADRMERYGLRSDAVSSYEDSFHGKSLLRFGKEDSAGCADCHGFHSVSAFNGGAALADRRAVNKICSRCHAGAGINFSMSGADHLALKMEDSPILRIEHVFLKVLTYGVLVFLLGMIALDLRRKVFCSKEQRPKSGRLVASVVAMSLSALVAGMGMAVVGIEGAEFAWLTSVGLMFAALAIYFIRRKPVKEKQTGKLYARFTVSERVQHVCLAVSFVVLALTGMPLRFAHVGWSHYLYVLFGGLEGARIAHRAAAVLMIGTWLWHCVHLLYRWKRAGFSLKSWTMWPSRKDFADLLDTVKYGLGLRKERPQYDRFQFREKFDYFAVYWGMPIMVLSGLVLWFPVYFGNALSELGVGIAYIAHSDEALLALLAIMVWHLYNTHFDPEHFPMSRVWYSGVLTESEMEHEHPAEKKTLDASDRREQPAEERPGLVKDDLGR